MLSFIVRGLEQDQSEPIIPIRWCISKGTLDVLKAKGVSRPFLLLSIVHDTREIDRKLVPLEQAMEYIVCRHAGEHTIRGIIVWPNDGDDEGKHLTNRVLSRESPYEFAGLLYDHDRNFKEDYLKNMVGGYLLEDMTVIKVNVGKEFFAPEPKEWEKWWVNLWFDWPAHDQCSFRRRRILAYTVQPFAVLLFVLWHSLWRIGAALVFLLIGFHGVKFTPIVHPFRDKLNDVLDQDDSISFSEACFYLSDKDGNRRSPLWLVLHPVSLMLIGFAVYAAKHYNLWAMRHKILVVGGVIALVLFVLWLVVSTIISHTTSPESKQKRLEKHKKQRELEQQEREAALNEVTCGNGMLMARVGDLPPRLRTFRLRFLDLKSKVCRPFPK